MGHVDRAWSCSFTWPGLGEQLQTMESVLRRMLARTPVGHSVEYLGNRFAALTTQLEEEKENVLYGKVPDHRLISGMWTAKNDARNYVVLGDPAVRLGG